MNTEIILPAPELKQALSGLNKLIRRKTTLPVLSCVRISRNKDGRVSLQGTDLDAHATFTLNNQQAGEPIETLVPLEQLNKAFKSSLSSGHDVALELEGKSIKLRYFIGNNPVQQPINSPPVAEWPECPVIDVDSKPLQPGFGEALRQALECCSDDPTRYTINGACLDASNPKAHYIVGTNGRFLFSANSFTFPLKGDVIVPDSKFITGSGLLDHEPCFLAVQSVPVKKVGEKSTKPEKEPECVKYICFQNRQWQFITREIVGNYPNWKQVLPTINGDWTILKLSDTAVEELLKVIPNLPGNDLDTHTVQLRIDGKSLLVAGRGKEDKDWTCVTINDVSITGKPKVIALDREYLLPALKFGLTELAIHDELTPMVCSKGGKRMVIMPVRLEGPPIPKPSSAQQTPPAPVPDKPQTTSAVTLASTEVQPKAEERKTEVSKTTAETSPKTETTVDSPFKLAMNQVDTIREALKQVLRDLAAVTDTLRVAEKDKKATDNEIDQFREKLREIQGIKI